MKRILEHWLPLQDIIIDDTHQGPPLIVMFDTLIYTWPSTGSVVTVYVVSVNFHIRLSYNKTKPLKVSRSWVDHVQPWHKVLFPDKWGPSGELLNII